jgi:predicted amidohydrolase YtcJ
MNADFTIINARIWTGDPARPRARSMRIERGRIVAIGDDDAIAQSYPTGGLIDARGATVTPGLIDSHLHLLTGGEFLSWLDLSSVRSRDEFEQRMGERHAVLGANEWLIAFGWASENFAERTAAREPDKSWLRAAGDRPVVCYRMDLHAALVNEAVLARCDLSREPGGGRIVRDERGEPTGLMVEAAAWELINPLIPKPEPSAAMEHLRQAQQHMHSLGVTAVGSMEYRKQLEQVYLPLRDELTLRCAITVLDRDWPLDIAYAKPRNRNAWEFEGNDQLCVIGYKAFIDGTLGSRTARMIEDYADDPDNRGLLVELAKDGHLCEWARLVADAGMSPSMHAIGDEAVRIALDAIQGLDGQCQPRIEHAQTIHPDDLPRFRNVIASMQPLHKADDGRYAALRLGEHRMNRFFPFRRLLNAGAILAFGSDWPVVSADPLRGIRAAVTGLTLDERPCCTDQNLTVDEAFRAYTADAARCLQLEHAGVLRPGGYGDCAIFERDPFTADWAAEPPRITMTIVGGTIVYDAAQST